LSTEVRELKIELKKAQSELSRANERLETVERERNQMEDQLAKIDLDRASAMQSKGTLQESQKRLEERLAKAEAARAKAEEALGDAQKERQQAMQQADRLMIDVDREKKRASELQTELEREREAHAGASSTMIEASRNPRLVDNTSEIAVPNEAKLHQLEEEVSRLERELRAAQQRAASSNGHGGDIEEIKRKAEEAYSGINDALSELRTNILLAKDLVAEHGRAVPDADAARTLEDAINVSVDRTEDAKGLLRALREVIEG
jgi:chromosome segregation ATPase